MSEKFDFPLSVIFENKDSGKEEKFEMFYLLAE
jgi:hypothetical protein